MIKQYLILLFVFLFFSSCVVSPRYSSNGNEKTSKKDSWTNNSSQTSYSKKSPSNKSSNKKFNIKDHELKGVSSWYGPNFHGKRTANGEVFDQYGVTAAHKTLPLGTVVRVINLDNDKSIILRITDRGPFVGDRILDCSFGAAKKLGFDTLGTTNVKIEIIEVGDGLYIHHTNKKND